jgi:hypothetical protein
MLGMRYKLGKLILRGTDMRIKDVNWSLVVITAFCCLCWFVVCNKTFGQELTPSQLSAKMATAKVGDVLSRAGNKEIKKAPEGKLNAKIFTSPQWDANGQPLLIRDDATGKVTSRGRYVKYVPDVNTAKLTVRREKGNASIKEYWTVPDSTVIKLSWTVETNASNVGFGNETLIFYDTVNSELFRTPPPMAWDADKKPVIIKVSYVDKQLTYDIIADKYTYPITVDPTSVVATNDGYVYCSNNSTYDTARNTTVGDIAATDVLNIGQYYTSLYRIYRSFLAFAIPYMTSITVASLYLWGYNDYSTTDFEVYLHTATHSNPIVVDDFNNFDGWQATGAYNGTILNNTWNSSSMVESGWIHIDMNAAGLSAILAKKNDTLKIVAISKEDYIDSAPTGAERIVFASSISEAGKEPYLSITFQLGSTSNIRSILSKDGVITPFMKDGVITPFMKP